MEVAWSRDYLGQGMSGRVDVQWVGMELAEGVTGVEGARGAFSVPVCYGPA